MKGFSGHDVNPTFLHLEEEDIALWLLVAAVSEVEHDYQSNARRTDSVVGWRLALLAEKMVILGNTLDQRCPTWTFKAFFSLYSPAFMNALN